MVSEIKLINKVFEDKKVRTAWDKDEKKFYVSVVDMFRY